MLECPRSTVTDTDKKSAPGPGDASPGGDPSPPDEFAHIPAARRRPPVLALVTAGLAVFLAARVRHDITFALSSSTPQPIGEARALAAKPLDQLPLNRYVRLEGLPDRENAVILDTQGSWKFSQLFRLHGTAGRFFVRRIDDPLPVELATHDAFAGRLVRFQDLSFAASIARHFENRVTATHFFKPADLRAALSSGAAPFTLADTARERVTLAATDRLGLDVARPGEIRIELPRDKFGDAAAARAAVETRGGSVVEVEQGVSGALSDRVVVIARFPPEARERALSEIGDLDRKVRLRPARRTHEVSLQELRATPDGFVLGKPGAEVTVPLADVLVVRTRAKLQIPDDAVLLIEGERPRDQWKTLVILAFLIAFAAVNLLALRRPA